MKQEWRRGSKPLKEGVGTELTFKFATPEAAAHFKSWLDGSGEQSYWDWMRDREDEEKGVNITGLRFDYHSGSVVDVKTGRIDNDWEPIDQ